MKRTILLSVMASAMLLSCGAKTQKGVSSQETPTETSTELSINDGDTDTKIKTAIRNYLLGNSSAVRLTATAKSDLMESSWPEVQCSVSGDLDSPSRFKNLSIRKVGEGKYKFECTCPVHGDKFVDFTTISASIAPDGVVQIDRVLWDEAQESSQANGLENSGWTRTKYGFSVPDCMYGGDELFVEDVPASVITWSVDDVTLCYWPGMGAWAVTDYPDREMFVSANTQIKNVTYSSRAGVYSGYTTDGRIWYMKKHLIEGREVVHADALVVIYPKEKQGEVSRLIDEVKGW